MLNADYQDVVDEARAATPEVSLKLDGDKLKLHGISQKSIVQSVLAGTHGVAISPANKNTSKIRVFLGGDGADLKSLSVVIGEKSIPLTAVAEITIVRSFSKLLRHNQFPVVHVTAALPAGGDDKSHDQARRLAEEVRSELQSDEYFLVRQ